MLEAQLQVVKEQIPENDRRDRLVPKQNLRGGKEKLSSISRAGNRYLRQLLVSAR